MSRQTMAMLASGALVALVTGFILDPTSFLGNVLAEIASILVSVVVAIYLIDRLSESRERAEWSEAREITLHSIVEVLNRMGFTGATMLLIYERDQPGYDRGDLNRLALFIARNREVLADTNSSRATPGRVLDMQSSREFLNAVTGDAVYLRDTLTARAIASRCDTNLIKEMVSVEEAFKRWSSTVQFIEDDWGLPDSYAWSEVAEFFDRLARLDALTPTLTT